MNSDDNSVCVIVRAYNAAPYISECIMSLRNQTYKFNIYIKILYDEGSTDNTLQVLRKLDLPSLSTLNRHFELIEHEKLSPFRSLLKYGFEEFAGSYSYYAILDYDNYYDQDYIELAVNHLAKNKCDFLYSLPKFVDNSKRELIAPYKIPPYTNKFLKYRILFANFIDASTIFISAQCLDLLITKMQILSSKTFDWIYEDWIIGALALNHCKSSFFPLSKVYYRAHEANITYQNVTNSQNGTNSNRDILTVSAFKLLFNDNLVARISCVISVFRWVFYYTLSTLR